MTLVTLRPDGTLGNTGAVVGAASAHAALSDDLNSSYVQLDPGEVVRVTLTDFTLPAGAVIKDLRPRARVTGTTSLLDGEVTNPARTTTFGVGYTISSPADVVLANISAWPETTVDAMIRLSLVNGTTTVYAMYLDVTYVAKPIVVVNAPTGTITNTNTPTISWTVS